MSKKNAATMQLSCDPTLSLPKEENASITNLAYTRVNVIRFDYTWKNIFPGDLGLPVVKRSPVFSIDSGGQTRWSMTLYPHGVELKSRQVSLFLCCESSDKSEVEAKFRFRAAGRSSEVVISPEMHRYCVFKCGTVMTGHGYKDFCPQGKLWMDGSLTIQCWIQMRLNESNIADQGAGESSNVPYRELGDDMAAALTTGKHTDFIINGDGVSFPVHKGILSARSSVFASMFEHDTKEQRENCVDIEDMTPEALKEMLRFIYTDKVNEIETVAGDLLPATEKYALDKLKVMCEEALCEILAVVNAADILILADLYRANKLKARAIDFIKNQTVDVMDTSGFKVILASYQHLTAEILRASLPKSK